MSFTDIIIILLTLGLAWYILAVFGIFGGNKAAKKAVEDKKSVQSLERKRKFMSWLMSNFENFANKVGGGIKDSVRVKYDFYIVRLEKRVPYLNRQWKPIEILGLQRMLAFIGILLMALGMSSLQFNILWLFGLLAFVGKIQVFIWEQKIMEEDNELEQDFPDLYLILNPKLKMGANARIAPTLTEYMQTLDHMHSSTEHLAIRKFIRLLRSTIEMYPDEVLALTKVREYYKTASIVNFCNIAIQAMNGIDNKEKLTAFEQELTRKKLDMMRKRAQALVEKGQRASYLMYVILFEFVVLTLWSRIGGNLDSFLGLM